MVHGDAVPKRFILRILGETPDVMQEPDSFCNHDLVPIPQQRLRQGEHVGGYMIGMRFFKNNIPVIPIIRRMKLSAVIR